ncbi:MAG: ABC transporter substrate-binding protein, partial [Candidatus Aenigmarchaeota archaeon]|nr:ABC transporter substrate-binding protein [Candidatus Aenigmarchaeota archaeon]
RSFIDQYKKTYNSDPVNDWFAGSSYDSVFIISNALRKCGGDTECVKNFLYNMDWYEGTIGRYKFDSKGDVIGIVFALKIVRNGAFALYDAP